MGRRHESVTFSIQPLINKIGGALSTAVISVSVILAGIKSSDSDIAAEFITSSGVTTIKIAMLLIPVICILLGFWIYLKKYRINEEFYGQIISDLKARGEISED
jgi:melibiose permease/lactose/raffinose/galactose permease